MRSALTARHGTKRLNSKRFRGFSHKTNKQIVINRDIKREYAEFDSEDDEPLYDEYGDDVYQYESGAYESDLWD